MLEEDSWPSIVDQNNKDRHTSLKDIIEITVLSLVILIGIEAHAYNRINVDKKEKQE
jgi:hypothetical protein